MVGAGISMKLIAMDLDGTLDNDQKTIDSPTREALLKAQRFGIRLLLASARPLHGLYRERDLLEMQTYGGMLMAYNGGLIADASGTMISADQMDRDQARQILRILETLPVTPILDDGERFYVTDPEGFMVQYESRNNEMPLTIVKDLAGGLSFAPFKLLMSVDPAVIAGVQKQIAESLPAELTVVQTAPFYLEVIPAHINKGMGLLNACKVAGIHPSETIAFGDSQNDIEMLKTAGIGIAMANADPKVKEAADRVTLSNNDNGIAAALADLL